MSSDGKEALAILVCLFIGMFVLILALVPPAPTEEEKTQIKAWIIQKQIDMMTKAQEDIEVKKQQWLYYLKQVRTNESKTK